MKRSSLSLIALSIFVLSLAFSVGAQTLDEAFTKGKAAVEAGHPQEGVTLLTKAIELKPDDPVSYRWRAWAYQDLKKYDEAVADFTKAIELDPKDRSALAGRADAYRMAGKFDQAIAGYNKVIEIDPNADDAYIGLGLVASSQRRYAESLAYEDKAVKIAPQNGYGYDNRGRAYRQLGKPNEALADFNKSVELLPKWAGQYAERAETLVDLGKYELAIADYKKAIELGEPAAGNFQDIAWAYLYWGKYSDAYDTATKRLAMPKTEISTAYSVLIGYIALRKMHQDNEAKVWIGKALKESPEGEWTTSLFKFFNGDLSEDQLLKLADSNDKLTEAHAYIGEDRMLDGKPAKAKSHFEWVRSHGNIAFTEYDLAGAELGTIPKS